MRARFEHGPVSVHAIAGTNGVLLGLDLDHRERDRFMGFAVARLDDAGRPRWLRGRRTFRSHHPRPRRDETFSTLDAPVQKFLWADHTVAPARTYRYRVVPLFGSAARLERGGALDLAVRTEDPAEGPHAVYFDHGVAATAASVARRDGRPPGAGLAAPARRRPSGGLEEALLAFVGEARGRRHGLRALLGELGHAPVLRALALAERSGADVAIVCAGAAAPAPAGARGDDPIRAARLSDVVRRIATPRAARSSFIVLLRDGEPAAVWTGSTGAAPDPAPGHPSVAHVLRDAAVAREFLAHWAELAADPEAPRLRARLEAPDALPARTALRVEPIFGSGSPSSGTPLERCGDLIERARSAVFLAAAPGARPLVKTLLARIGPCLRFVAGVEEPPRTRESPGALPGRGAGARADASSGRPTDRSTLPAAPSAERRRASGEQSACFLVDPLGDDPLVVTGRATLDGASGTPGDGSLLVIRGDSRVADVYLAELMRLFSQQRLRALARTPRRDAPWRFLAEGPAWCAPYYERDTVESRERLLFR